MEAKEVINKLKTILGMEIKLEQQMLADGVTTIESDLFEAGKEVFIVNGEERVPLPIGEYELTDGRFLVVTQEGIIAEIKDAPMGEEEPPMEQPGVEVPVEASVETPAKKVVESQVKETYFEEIEKLKAEIVELKAQIEAKNEVKEEEVIELKEEVKPISFNPENVNKVDLVDLTPKREKSMRDKILESIYNK